MRSVGERAREFAHGYSKKLMIRDAADHALPGVSADVRGMVSPVVLATILERVSAHLEVKRNHPPTTRRYYKRVAY